MRPRNSTSEINPRSYYPFFTRFVRKLPNVWFILGLCERREASQRLIHMLCIPKTKYPLFHRKTTELIFRERHSLKFQRIKESQLWQHCLNLPIYRYPAFDVRLHVRQKYCLVWYLYERGRVNASTLQLQQFRIKLCVFCWFLWFGKWHSRLFLPLLSFVQTYVAIARFLITVPKFPLTWIT
jgi:hypothetical protein